MNNAIINNGYKVGSAGRNLVLETFGRVYVKVKDRYYELNFKNSSMFSSEGSSDPDIIIIDSPSDLDTMTYPGDNKIIITKNGYVYYTDDGNYNLIRFQNFGDSLELNELIVNGQVIINVEGNIPPLVINSSTLVENLNAQYLNGYTSEDFAIKNAVQFISGNWTFGNSVTFNDRINVQNNLYNQSTDTLLDFASSLLVIDDIVVRNSITLPDSFYEDLEARLGNSADLSVTRGVDGELWVNKKLKITDASFISDFENDDFDRVNDLVENANYYLNRLGEIDNEIFYNALSMNYDDYLNWNGEGKFDFIFRDFTQQSQINAANAILAPYNVTITDFEDIMYGYYDYTTETKYLGSIIQINYTQRNIDTENEYLSPNTIVRYQYDSYDYLEGIIISATDTTILVRCNNDLTSIDEPTIGYEVVIVDHRTNPNKKGGVLLNSNITKYPSIDLIDNINYSYSYITKTEDGEVITYLDRNGRLTTNDNIKARFGRLDGLAITQFGNLTGIGIYIKGNAYIENANLSFNGATILNADGSGQLAGGLLEWTANTLEIDGSLIINDSISSDKIISLDGSKLIDNTVTSAKIVSLDGSKIIDSTITPAKFDRAYLELTGGTMSGTINSQAIIPNISNQYDLGTTTLSYRYLYSTNIRSNNLQPLSNNVGNVGTSTLRYLSGYINSIYTDNVFINNINKTNEINSIVISGNGTQFHANDGNYYTIDLTKLDQNLGIAILSTSTLNLTTDINITPTSANNYVKSYTRDAETALTITCTSGTIRASEGCKVAGYITQNSTQSITISAVANNTSIISVIANYNGSTWTYNLNVEYYNSDV